MPRRSTPPQPGPTLLDVLEEASDDPPLCPHAANVRVDTGGWTLEVDRYSRYYGTWVHGDPNCRRPRHLSKQEGY